MFKDDIKRTIGKVLNKNGYKMITLDSGCVYFIKRYSEQLAFYIRCSDNRKYSGGVHIQLFFSPIQRPDDSITTFGIGIEINVLTVFNVTDEIMIKAGDKIVAIEKEIGCCSPVVLNELEEPFFVPRCYEFYKNLLLVYNSVAENIEIRESFEQLKENVRKMIKKRKDREAYRLGYNFIENLSKDYFEQRGIVLELSDIKNYFAEQLYSQCILDA